MIVHAALDFYFQPIPEKSLFIIVAAN